MLKSIALLCLAITVQHFGTRVDAQGYPDFQINHFLELLSKLVNKVYDVDGAAVLKNVASKLATSTVTKQIRQVHWKREPFLPRELRRNVLKIDTAVSVSQLAYDPNRGKFIMGLGPLQGFKILDARWDAERFKPAHVVLESRHEQNTLWVSVRGTHEVQDLLTDLTTEPVAFMDGNIHKGIFKAAQHIRKQVRKHADASLSKVWLTGHSLGGGAAAIAAVMLQDDGYNAKAIVFGAPSCVETARWIGQSLRKHVISLVLDSDIIPRLNNHTLSDLLEPQDALGQVKRQLDEYLASFSSSVFGVWDKELTACDGAMMCPPGRNYVLESAGHRGWGIREMMKADLARIVVGPRMLSDHSIQSYIEAVQAAHLRHMPTRDEL